jgi:hypothetical protein
MRSAGRLSPQTVQTMITLLGLGFWNETHNLLKQQLQEYPLFTFVWSHIPEESCFVEDVMRLHSQLYWHVMHRRMQPSCRLCYRRCNHSIIFEWAAITAVHSSLTLTYSHKESSLGRWAECPCFIPSVANLWLCSSMVILIEQEGCSQPVSNLLIMTLTLLRASADLSLLFLCQCMLGWVKVRLSGPSPGID